MSQGSAKSDPSPPPSLGDPRCEHYFATVCFPSLLPAYCFSKLITGFSALLSTLWQCCSSIILRIWCRSVLFVLSGHSIYTGRWREHQKLQQAWWVFLCSCRSRFRLCNSQGEDQIRIVSRSSEIHIFSHAAFNHTPSWDIIDYDFILVTEISYLMYCVYEIWYVCCIMWVLCIYLY